MEINSTFEYLKALDTIAEIIEAPLITPDAKVRLKKMMAAVRAFEKHALTVETAQERLVDLFVSQPFLMN